jgi:hypothetical protein
MNKYNDEDYQDWCDSQDIHHNDDDQQLQERK